MIVVGRLILECTEFINTIFLFNKFSVMYVTVKNMMIFKLFYALSIQIYHDLNIV